MNSIGKRRLLKLANFLDTVPVRKFDMDYFVIKNNQPDKILPLKDCGTVACALGYAATCIPEFQRAGLTVEPRDNGWPLYDKNGNYEIGYEAGEVFFNLNGDESKELFDPFYYREGHKGPRSVARKIRALVKKYENQKRKVSS